MNIYDVSKHAGVSIATVSRVLNGNPNVSEKTRNKVMNVMAELGYTPNVFARGLGLNTMQTIGIMCSDSSDPYLANAIYYLERALRSFEYDAILCCTGYDLDAKQKYFNLLRSKRVDAIILAGSKFVEMRPKDNSYLIEAAKDLPLMLVNGYLEGENIVQHPLRRPRRHASRGHRVAKIRKKAYTLPVHQLFFQRCEQDGGLQRRPPGLRAAA